jgi:5-methylcytosine-specific restriction enzyme A
MPIYKRCGRCGKRISSGVKCDCFKGRHKEYDKFARDKKSDSFYHSDEWKLARKNALILDFGIDVYVYMTTGEVVLADAVHHIEPLKDNWDRRCDLSNLISLSSETHSMIEKMYEKDKEGTMKMLYEMIEKFREEGI